MKHVLLMIAIVMLPPTVDAAYKETMDPAGLTRNLKTDYGLVDDNAKSNQSEKLQKAIDEVSEKGGGKLILPKGTYRFSGIYLRSNVHILIEEDTVIRPYWPAGTKTVVFTLGVSRDTKDGYIENVSIRGLGGTFIVDYSDRGSVSGEGIRTINCRQVRNFLLSDIYIKDSFTTYCAVIFTPAKDKDARNRAVFRPTHGLVKNLKCTNSSPGYGLVQMHAGDYIQFENLKAIGGGVTFRLETGAGGHNGGIHNITARNLYCEDGSTAVLLGPHKAQNGVVHVDGITVKSCAFAVTMGPGYVEKRNLGDPHYKPGRFADGTTVRNIHAIFGTNAAISLKGLANVPKEYLKELRFDKNDRALKCVRGPSVGVVLNRTAGSWNPIIENVTSEDFKYNKGILKIDEKQPRNWRELLEGLPILREFPPDMRKKEDKKEKQGAND